MRSCAEAGFVEAPMRPLASVYKRGKLSADWHWATCEAQLFGHIRQELDLFVPI